jgi:hypothetical protein
LPCNLDVSPDGSPIRLRQANSHPLDGRPRTLCDLALPAILLDQRGNLPSAFDCQVNSSLPGDIVPGEEEAAAGVVEARKIGAAGG